ncbi:TonB-dependent receptor [Phaeodactylibacter xiamenensis]|uniref:TonB-dependent receptor n=1 Tax=Phaeodactylibacter xiamenensis TaxID=1524460 RepID=UPI003CCBF54E
MKTSISRLFIALIFVFAACLAFAQTIHISGIVTDSGSGESLIGALVSNQDKTLVEVTNSKGYFNFLLPARDTLVLQVQYVGYETASLGLEATKDTVLNIGLRAGVSLQTVEVTSHSTRNQLELGMATLSPSEIERIPTLFGEADVLRALQILPGISGGKEGTSLLYVRGGTPDQNIILLDDIPIYFPAHLGGFLSVFEPRSIQQLKVYKGGFPARYGGRVSGVVDIQMKDGNHKEVKKEIGLGLLSSRLFIEGPLKKEKTSFHFSARRSFLDLLYSSAQLIINSQDERVSYGILDANLKIKHKLDNNNQLYFSYYGGGDNIRLKFRGSNPQYTSRETTRIRWGNQLAGLRWRHLRKRWVWSNAVSFTSFGYGTRSEFERKEIVTGDKTNEINQFQSKIVDFIFHSSADFSLSNQVNVVSGIRATRHNFQPSIERFKGSIEGNSVDTSVSVSNTVNHELSFYTEANIQLPRNWSANVGVHANWFVSDVRREDYQFLSVQPRLLLNYQPSPTWKHSLSISQMVQPLHLLSNSGGGLPVDIWVPASSVAPVEQSWLYAAGTRFYHKGWEIQLEAYYKTLTNLIAFQEGTSFFRGATDWESKIVAEGKGVSYGLEAFIKKHWTKWDLMISYTLSRHQRTFPQLNNGLSFPYRYDRRHDLALSISFKPKDNQRLSFLWVYHSGDALSLAQGGFDIHTLGFGSSPGSGFHLSEDYHEAHYYGSRNSFRMPDYHRLDLSWQVEKTMKKGIRKWIVGLYNSYNRINPYYIYFDENERGERQLYQFGLFPVLPAVSWVRSW